ncbi:uncharacterized protein HKW66_Vig0078200 [Vigna angularis]|uniref:NB-ARC domain-containing protein n=1 Tax=Phaseolus angularis TaxID=3914 RepID=A0A8T0K9A5_PHAAN|nr:uncharacterized protein HKW66_Vig0078200 [Vigna angularis]
MGEECVVIEASSNTLLSARVPYSSLFNPGISFDCTAFKRGLMSTFKKVESLRSLDHLIGQMPKLQILKLKSCPSLEMPKTLTQLQDLRHVMIDECVETPPNISKLRNLRTLGIFVAGSKPRCGLRELHSLKMGGTLRTKGFENVPNERDAKQENLIDKKDLNILQLSWGGRAN